MHMHMLCFFPICIIQLIYKFLMFQLFIYFPFHTQQFKDFTGAKSTPFKTLAFQIFKQYTSCHYHQVINGNFN